MEIKKVCVIGAGPSGLAALRHIKTSPSLQGFCYEQNKKIGGIWKYTEKTGVHSAMYKDLRTNLPTDNMAYSWDFPFKSEGPLSYVSHEQVYRYLHDFVTHFDLWDMIKFQSCVTKVSRINNPLTDGEKWRVTILNLTTETEETLIFDSVIVCNGHHFKPIIPKIEGLENFQGKVMHSINYRTRDLFKNKRVVVMGCGPSGTDITLEIATVAKETTMSFRKPPLPSAMPKNVRQTSLIKTVTPSGFKFMDGSECEADILLLCTGYTYDFPFLDESCEVQVVSEGKEITPLYMHMIHMKYPTLCFMGISFIAIIFYMLDLQSRFYIKYLEGHMTLPSLEQMEQELEEERRLRQEIGQSRRQSHQLGPLQWSYYTRLAQKAGCPEELKRVFVDIYDVTYDRRLNFATLYKYDICNITDEHSFTYKCCEENPEDNQQSN